MCISANQQAQKDEARQKSIEDSKGVNASGGKDGGLYREQKYDDYYYEAK